ncbi:alpha/beta fold hydrolase [Fictibacillus sp. FJAT-27399]|uniref:alpha/beta fold hydrolase n=1 Tax=Fictibacillus sp. FJAT-27399 TaxID=1729689 RepID=UPI0012E39EB4|nr:alpha/beta hydrolase [Fictibacillus sp. FJAT-27399]
MKKKTNEKGLFFDGPDTRLSYLDFGGEGTTILALHGHMNEGLFAEGLAEHIQEACRMIALDQRGHGESGRPSSYENDLYVEDAIALLNHLNIEKVGASIRRGGHPPLTT